MRDTSSNLKYLTIHHNDFTFLCTGKWQKETEVFTVGRVVHAVRAVSCTEAERSYTAV